MAIPINNYREHYIDHQFPNICCNYEVLGNNVNTLLAYNCVAFAADDITKHYWPSAPGLGNYWPPNIKRVEDIQSFIALFASLNYIPCNLNELYEDGFEKVAIYVDETHKPTHVAKQCIGDNGCWRSKLAHRHVIKHTLGGLCGLFNRGSDYGNVALILKRPARIIRAMI